MTTKMETPDCELQESQALLNNLLKQHGVKGTGERGKSGLINKKMGTNSNRAVMAEKNGNTKGMYWVKKKKIPYEQRIMEIAENPEKRYHTTWETGSSYTGDWKDNKKHGYGTFISSSGTKYEGDWEENKRTGKGTLWVKEENGGSKSFLRKVYRGSWLDNKKHGLGTYFFTSGDRYEGMFKFDKRHGEGALFCANGDVYRGGWIKDKKCGFARLIMENGNIYEGCFLDDKKEGPGEFFYKHDRRVYVGEWVNDIPTCGVYANAEFLGSSELHGDGKPLPFPRNELRDSDKMLRETVLRIRALRREAKNKAIANMEK